MRVLVTGVRGQVGEAAARALEHAGHDLTGTDLLELSSGEGEPRYVQANLADAGDAYAVVDDFDAVVHTAAIARPGRTPNHTLFLNNLMATYNVAEAAVRAGVRYLVNISSVTVLGHTTARRRFPPEYLPVDENHPLRPQDPYALAKLLGEKVIDAAVDGSDVRAISLRPPWVLSPSAYEHSLRPLTKDPHALKWDYWSYIDVRDLASAITLAVEALDRGPAVPVAAHEPLFVAAEDNALGQPLLELVRECFGSEVVVRQLARADSSGVSSARAQDVLGFIPRYSWRNVVDTLPG